MPSSTPLGWPRLAVRASSCFGCLRGPWGKSTMARCEPWPRTIMPRGGEEEEEVVVVVAMVVEEEGRLRSR